MNLGELVARLLQDWGYGAVFLLPMLESAGVPVPGETMLLAAGVYAATTGRLNIAGVIAAAAAGAIIGDSLGYLAGRKAGRAVLLRYGRWVGLDAARLRLVERFFARHGPKTVFLARFVAILRTWGALLAGLSRMPYRKFLVYNAAGGVTWAAGYGLLAFALGRAFDRYRAVVERAGLVVAGGAVLVVIVLVITSRRRIERWALGDPESEPPRRGG